MAILYNAGADINAANLAKGNITFLTPFKSILSGIVPVNKTECANPIINTVLDEVMREYDEITLKVYTRSGLGYEFGGT